MTRQWTKDKERVVHKANARSWSLNPVCGAKGDVTTDTRRVTCKRCAAAAKRRGK